MEELKDNRMFEFFLTCLLLYYSLDSKMYENPLLAYLISKFFLILIAEIFQFMVGLVPFLWHLSLRTHFSYYFHLRFLGTVELFVVLWPFWVSFVGIFSVLLYFVHRAASDWAGAQ
jgi:hypothetical protein